VSRWRAIIFDLDDTLYPERDYVLSGFRAVAEWAKEHLGISALQGFAELRSLFDSGVRGDTFDRWLRGRGLRPEGFVPKLVEVYREHNPILTPFAEVPALLERLGRVYSLGLVSDGYLSVQQRKLASLKLAHFFEAIVFSDEWGRDAWKPNTKPFEVVLKKLRTEPKTSVYIADNPLKDFIGARRIGIYTIRVQHPEGEYSRLEPPSEEHAPHYTITSLSELDSTLEKLRSR